MSKQATQNSCIDLKSLGTKIVCTRRHRMKTYIFEKPSTTGREPVEVSRKERVREAILHRQTEKVPYHIDYTPPVKKMLQEHYRVGDVDEAIGNHIMIVMGNDRRPLYADPSVYGNFSEDDFGVVWRNSPYDRGPGLQAPFDRARLCRDTISRILVNPEGLTA